MARLVFKVEHGQHVLFDIVPEQTDVIDDIYEALEGFKPPGTVEFDESMGQWFRYYDLGMCKSFISMHDAMSGTNPLHTYTPVES